MHTPSNEAYWSQAAETSTRSYEDLARHTMKNVIVKAAATSQRLMTATTAVSFVRWW